MSGQLYGGSAVLEIDHGVYAVVRTVYKMALSAEPAVRHRTPKFALTAVKLLSDRHALRRARPGTESIYRIRIQPMRGLASGPAWQAVSTPPSNAEAECGERGKTLRMTPAAAIATSV